MTTLPDTVKIGPFTYSIVVDQAAIDRCGQQSGANLDGNTDANTQTITVRPEMPPEREADTVVHELLHAAIEHAGLNCRGPLEDHGAEEQVVNTLSPWLLGALRDNPQLVDYLMAQP